MKRPHRFVPAPGAALSYDLDPGRERGLVVAALALILVGCGAPPSPEPDPRGAAGSGGEEASDTDAGLPPRECTASAPPAAAPNPDGGTTAATPATPADDTPPTEPCGEAGVPRPVFSALFSADGQRLIFDVPGFRDDSRLFVVRVSDGALLRRIVLTRRGPRRAIPKALLGDDRLVVQTDTGIRVVRLDDPEPLVPLDPGGEVIRFGSKDDRVLGVAGRSLLLGRAIRSDEARVDLIDLDDGHVVAGDLLRAPWSSFPDISVANDGSLLLVSGGGTTTLHRLPDRRVAWTSDGEGGVLSPDGRWVAVAGPKTLLLDAATGKPARTFAGSASVAFGPDSQRLVLNPEHGEAVVTTLDGAQTFTLPEGTVELAAGGHSLVQGRYLHGPDGRFVAQPGGADTGGVQALAFSADGAELRALGPEGLVRLRAADLAVVGTTPLGGDAAAFARDGSVAAFVAGTYRHPRLWVVRGDVGCAVTSMELPPTGNVLDLSFAPDARLVAVRANTRVPTQIRQVADGALIASLPATVDDGSHLAFSPTDGNFAALAARDVLEIYDRTGRPLRRVSPLPERRGQQASLFFQEAAVYSPDGRWLALGRGANIDTESGTIVEWPMRGVASTAAVSPSGRWVALFNRGGVNETPVFLTLARAHTPDTIELEEEPSAVAFAPDGSKLAVGRSDGTIGLYCRPPRAKN